MFTGHCGNRLKRLRNPARRRAQFQRDRLAVQRGGEVNDIRFRRAGRNQRPVKPIVTLAPLDGRLDVALVLKIVRDDQRRAASPAPPAADPLPGAQRFEGHAAGQHDAILPPRMALFDSVGLDQTLVVRQLQRHVFQMGAGLRRRVGDDPDISFAAQRGRLQHVGQRRQCRFRAAARADQVDLHAAPIAHRVELRRQPDVHRRWRLGEMFRQVFCRPVEQAKGRIDGLNGCL